MRTRRKKIEKIGCIRRIRLPTLPVSTFQTMSCLDFFRQFIVGPNKRKERKKRGKHFFFFLPGTDFPGRKGT